MEVPVVALAARTKRWAVGGRRSHPLVSFSASRWAVTTGRSASTMCNRVTTSVRKLVRHMWSCGAGLGGVGRLRSVQQHNQTCARVHAKGEWSRNNSWRLDCNSLEAEQDVVPIVYNGGQCFTVACFALPGFCRLLVICLDGDDTIFVVVIICLFGVFPFLCPLCDGASENIQELDDVRLPVENCGLRKK